jgi:hypothetical protein
LDSSADKFNFTKTLSGESNEVSEDVVNSFKENFSEVISGFEEKYIFNADECRLLFRAMPDKTLPTKGDKFKSGRNSKEKLTVLLAANVMGEKLPPFVIGKSNQPRCFNHLTGNFKCPRCNLPWVLSEKFHAKTIFH